MTVSSALSSIERQEELQKYIISSGRVTVNEICERFDISEATARRDLEILSEQGKIRRIHGGAIPVHKAPPELPVHQRMNERSESKSRIGELAAQQIQNGETIFLGTGTTVFEVARHITDKKDLTVITNSLLIMNFLIDFPHITLIGLGGLVRRTELSLIGHITEQALTELRADKIIIGIHGIDPEKGLTNHYLPETMTDRRILEMGEKVIIVADHKKCGQFSTSLVAPVTVVDVLITDSNVSPEFVTLMEKQNVKVLLA
jgi:DeoR/GlpR family transcriptional regulator of sugar metabolism